MAFKIEAFQNKFLPPGQTRVDAILTVTAGADVQMSGGQLVVGFIVDKSGSMAGERMESVKNAVGRAIALLDPSAWFFVVAFDSSAQVIVRETQATTENKVAAGGALQQLHAGGGTAMSTGLAAARAIFERAPNAIRQAVFLTDGKNESESAGNVTQELQQCEGVFECDCWGVGTDWRVGEVQEIARELLGRAALVPDPQGIDAAFRTAIEKANTKALKDVRLRLWTPQGSTIAFVKQVNPTIEELTAKAKVVSPQVREYMTGAWGAGEARDFHVTIDVKAGKVNDEMLAARPSVVYLASGPSGWVEQEEKPGEARLFAVWTPDDSLSSRIDHHVAHYTGQGELAEAIETGLRLREQGDEAKATQFLGKAVKLAHESNNGAMTQRLKKVVDVVDPTNGTVRLKKKVEKAAEMDLQLESRTTKRVGKKAPPPGEPSP
jgi:VWA domain-containing protein